MPVRTRVRKTARAWASVNAFAIRAEGWWPLDVDGGVDFDYFLADSAVEDVHEYVHVQIDGRRGIVGERRANKFRDVARPDRGEFVGAEVGTQASERPVVHRGCSGTPAPPLLRFLEPGVRVLRER